MTGHPLALDETWEFDQLALVILGHQVLAKSILQTAGPVATEISGAIQLCAGLSVGIEGVASLQAVCLEYSSCFCQMLICTH